jgi:pimeloyl-ACP methyl ester carboxylesterase
LWNNSFFLFISYKIILKMKFKLKSGLDIAASSWGKEADPLVVLMHGGGQTRHAWGKTGEVLGNSGFHGSRNRFKRSW